MTLRRQPSQPPHIPGFRAIELIGTGGYADVFLYEQEMPTRRVAIKVLAASALADEAKRHFTDEANLMARVSTHPYIVNIFHAAIAGDGRPYLVMEYFPGPNFMERARSEQLAVPEVLRVGVQVCSAVETAHRAGILHRDIKPANILTSEFDNPGLTDFGIASRSQDDNRDGGLSIPWSPPEAFGDGALDARGDVYSLAATLYTLLVGRSPFEVTGGSNGSLELMGRIERSPLPPTRRADVPASLERVLALGMAKDPAHRPDSAAALARLLQEVESELLLRQTPLELPEQARRVARNRDDDGDATRLRGVTAVEAQPPSGLIAEVPERVQGPVSVPTWPKMGTLDEALPADTVARRRDQVAPADETPTRSAKLPVLAGAGVVIVAAAVVAGVLVFNKGGSNPAAPTTTFERQNTTFDVVPSPTNLKGVLTAAGAHATFTWTAPDPKLGDRFVYNRTDIDAAPQDATGTQVDLDGLASGSKPCLSVQLVRANGQGSEPVRACAS